MLVYITSLDDFTAYMNGEKVGNINKVGPITYELWAPEWTAFYKEINYMTYDVTSCPEGEEKVTQGVVIGNGWYNSKIPVGQATYYSESNTLELMSKLLITYKNRSTDTIVTEYF